MFHPHDLIRTIEGPQKVLTTLPGGPMAQQSPLPYQVVNGSDSTVPANDCVTARWFGYLKPFSVVNSVVITLEHESVTTKETNVPVLPLWWPSLFIVHSYNSPVILPPHTSLWYPYSAHQDGVSKRNIRQMRQTPQFILLVLQNCFPIWQSGTLQWRAYLPVIFTPHTSLLCEYCGHQTGACKCYIKHMRRMNPFNHSEGRGCLFRIVQCLNMTKVTARSFW